jgi:hypothetical protein
MFKSKQSSLGNAYQAFINDLALTKALLQDVAAGVITQEPAEPIERPTYVFLMDVLNNEADYNLVPNPILPQYL